MTGSTSEPAGRDARVGSTLTFLVDAHQLKASSQKKEGLAAPRPARAGDEELHLHADVAEDSGAEVVQSCRV